MTPQIQFVSIEQLVAGNNPRTHFDEEKHQQLCASMREHGFMVDEPLLVREREPDIYEIVKGERRWRAAAAVGIGDVPVVVAVLTPGEARILALIENMQRADLTPMEEAIAFHALCTDPAEPCTQKELAQKLGIVESTISKRMKLFSMKDTAAASALDAGILSPRHLVLLGTLPTVDLREEWTRKTLRNPWGESPMTAEKLEERLRADVMKDLRTAGFDPADATLVPVVQKESTGERVFGGACSTDGNWTCPFSSPPTGKGRSALCMHPACFRAKEEAGHERWRATHDDPEKNISTLPKAENDKLWATSGEALEFSSPYVELDDKPHEADLKATVRHVEPWRKLIEGQAVPIVVARDEKGKAHKLVLRDHAITAAVENKHRIFKNIGAAEIEEHAPRANNRVDAAVESMAREAQDASAREAAQADEEMKERVWMAQTGALAEAMTSVKHPPEGLFATLFGIFVPWFTDAVCIAAGRRGVDSENFEKTITKGNDGSFAAALVELILHQGWWENGGSDPEHEVLLKKFAKLYAVDLKAPEKAVRAQFKAEQAQKAEAAEVAEGLVWKHVRAADSGEDYRFNSSQIAENPERCELTFPKALKITASVSLSRVNGEWVLGWFVQGPKFGTSDPCAANGTKYGSRELALRTGLLAIQQQLQAANAAAAAQERVEAWIAGIGASSEKKKKTAEGAKGAKGNPVVDQKAELLDRARELRGSGEVKSTGALADALLIDATLAGQLWDALIDEEHDAKAAAGNGNEATD